jgi:hypothetical protein
MFPDWKVDQLFQTHDGGIDFIPEPAKPQAATTPTGPIASTGLAGQHQEAEVSKGLVVRALDEADLLCNRESQ